MRLSTFTLALSVSSALCASIPKRVANGEQWKTKKAAIDGEHANDVHVSLRVRDSDADVTFPSAVSQESCVKPLLPELDKSKIEPLLKTFTEFQNRYFNGTHGKEASDWLFSKVQEVLDASDAKDATVRTFEHKNWTQDSIIATIPGKTENIIVVGSHIDTLSLDDDDFENQRAPGADDDGSGTFTILEAMRVLLLDPKIANGEAENTLEFHWYSAEEPGFLGSDDVFQSYKANSKSVKAMLEQDMTGYVKNGTEESFGVITSNTDVPLTDFIKKVIDAYCDIPYVETECTEDGCSDYVSAMKAGYPGAFVFESAYNDSNPNIHTEQDVIEDVNFDHVIEHAKLTVGFAYELGFTPEF